MPQAGQPAHSRHAQWCKSGIGRLKDFVMITPLTVVAQKAGADST
jgi:hypothetical protein